MHILNHDASVTKCKIPIPNLHVLFLNSETLRLVSKNPWEHVTKINAKQSPYCYTDKIIFMKHVQLIDIPKSKQHITKLGWEDVIECNAHSIEDIIAFNIISNRRRQISHTQSRPLLRLACNSCWPNRTKLMVEYIRLERWMCISKWCNATYTILSYN